MVDAVIPAVGTQDPITPADGSFSVPEAYSDRAYLKDVKSMDDVYKMLDGSQTLLGKKVTFPTDQSTDEERVSFYKSAGMPEKSEEYVFEKFGEKEREVDIDNKFKAIFHKHGLSGKAVTGMQKDVETMVAETMDAKKKADDAAFDELSSKVLGERVDDILASSKKLIEENIPSELAEHFAKLPNPALVTMSAVIENFRQKYISEDKITEGDRVSGISGVNELRAKGQKLMADPAYKDAMHANYKKVNEEINEIYKQIGKLSV